MPAAFSHVRAARRRPAGDRNAMSAVHAPLVPAPSADQKRIALDSFKRANEAVQSGNFDYAINLLLTCCKIDPANFAFRQALRKTQKDKFGNNMRGSRFSFLSTSRSKAHMKAAKAGRDYLRVLEYG